MPNWGIYEDVESFYRELCFVDRGLLLLIPSVAFHVRVDPMNSHLPGQFWLTLAQCGVAYSLLLKQAVEAG